MTKYTICILSLALFTNLGIAQNKAIKTDMSSIDWTGSKVTGSHTGSITITDGSVSYENGRFAGGTFTIDMTSITNTDMSGNMSDKLVGHLKSDDFFGVATHPTATLVITEVSPGEGGLNITADLTIKGKTAPVHFTAEITQNSAVADITIDRTIYDVKYGSGKFFDNLGDKMISDNFDLVVKLAF